jgi:Trypsin-like peptidase domain
MARRTHRIAVASLLLIVLGFGGSAAAPKSAYVEAPMQIATEGPTAAEQMQMQADLSRWLLAELPATAEQAAMRVGLTPDEIGGIDQAPRPSLPLKIGLVKAIGPAIEVLGLGGSGPVRQPSRGVSAPASPTGDGGYVWAAVVATEGAGAIRLHVENFSLPRNVSLYLHSRTGEAYGPYSGTGPNGTGEFWTATIFGSEAILQLRVTAPATDADLRAVSLRVQEAGLITQHFAGGFGSVTEATAAPPPPGWPCGNANCIVDATCINDTQANALKLAMAKMEWIAGAFIYTCTGGLLSDNNPSQNNFFLTANHCLSKNNNAQNVNFYWRFATDTCNTTNPCPNNSGWPYQTAGSTVSKTGRKGDFTLLHLNTNPPAGSVFLGWTSAPVANTNGADLFRVSNPNFGPQVYSQHDVDTSTGTCSGWPRGERIYSRDIVGATDGGSSGSPVVNTAVQVVGQLSGACGFNPNNVCSGGPGEDNATVDGAFAFYFSQVQPILSP